MQIVLEAQRLEQWLTVDQRVEEISTTGRGRRKISWKPRCINFNYYLDINNIMASEKEQMGVSNPFLNPLWFWQNYLVNWIEGSRGFYESAIKANEH
jgi:hypothetical protein